MPSDPMGLPAPVTAWLDELAYGRRRSAHTVTAYRRDLAALCRLIAPTAPGEVVQADIRRAAARLHAQGLEPASIARTLSGWRSFYDWWIGARPAEAPGANPVRGVRAPRRRDRLPKALSVEQAVRLAGAPVDDAAVLAVRDRAMVELLYSSGLRLAELVSLDWRHFGATREEPASTGWIDLVAKTVTVTGKGRRTRSVPVGTAARTSLDAWLAMRDRLPGHDGRALFLSIRGTRLSAASVEARVARAARAAGLEVHVHPHMLRHAMASHVLQSSGDLRAVQELLGHASVSTTQVYTRLDWQHLAKAYDAAHPRAQRVRK